MVWPVLASFVPLRFPPQSDSYSPPPTALSLDPFVTLVNLVYSFPSLVCRDDYPRLPTSDPRLPLGGVVDHLLLRLTAALQLTQILLEVGDILEDAEGNCTPTNDSYPMDVDVDESDLIEGEEKTDLLHCWTNIRIEAGCARKVCIVFIDASTHLYKRVCPSIRPSVRNQLVKTIP